MRMRTGVPALLERSCTRSHSWLAIQRTRLRRSDAGGHRRGGRLLQGRRLLPVRRQARPVPGAARRAASPSAPNRTPRLGRPGRAGRAACPAGRQRPPLRGRWRLVPAAHRVPGHRRARPRPQRPVRRAARPDPRSLHRGDREHPGPGRARVGVPPARLCRADPRHRRRPGPREGRRARRSSSSSTWSTCWAGASCRPGPTITRHEHPTPRRADAHHDRTERSFHALRDGLQTSLLASFPELIARIGWNRAQIAAHQHDRLRALLAHAVERLAVPCPPAARHRPAAVDAGDLSLLPVMTKAEMMNELDDVFTDRRLTRPAVERALAEAGPEPATLLGSYLALTSGGSSGQRGVFVLDQPAAVQFFGSLTRGLVARLDAMGGPPPGGLPIAMVAAGSPVHATGVAAPLCAGRCRAAVQVPGVPVTLPAVRHRRAAQRPAGARALRLPVDAGPARPPSGRPAACGSRR